jgi:hypothetical protein
MSHFLARLLARARGTALRVEPIVAPRFAPTPIVEIASEVETSRPERDDQHRTVEEKSSPRAVARQEAPAEKAEPKILPEPEKPSSPQQPEKLLVPVEMSAVDSTIFVRPSSLPNRPVLALKNGTVRRNLFTASRSKRPRPVTPFTRTSRNLERDSLTPNESSEQPPIVRVTIGRIDVRATPPAVPSRKSSTQSEPKLTLDAYLKSRREGTR